MEVALSERFPALTPLAIRKEKATEIFIFVKRMNNYSSKLDKKGRRKSVMRKPAGDDWF